MKNNKYGSKDIRDTVGVCISILVGILGVSPDSKLNQLLPLEIPIFTFFSFLMLSGGLVYFLIKTVYFRERMLAWNEVLESRRFAQRKNMNALAELNTFYRNNIENRSSDFVQEKENIAHIIADCILINCTKLAEILSLLTRHDCHTCIKSFDKPETVNLIARDEHKLPRNPTKSFSYSENTAFQYILDTPANIYKNNNLIESYEKGEYKNSERDWQKYYNATIVKPIIKGNYKESDLSKDTVMGFICADSKQGEFDGHCEAFIRDFANLFHLILTELELYKEIKENDNSLNERIVDVLKNKLGIDNT